MKKRRMKRFLTRSLVYWGILAVKVANKDQEDCSEDGIHLQKLARDVIVASHGHHASIHISTGATPLLPSVYNMEVVEVPSIGVLLKSKLD